VVPMTDPSAGAPIPSKTVGVGSDSTDLPADAATTRSIGGGISGQFGFWSRATHIRLAATRWYRVTHLVLVTILLLLCSGILYGWPALLVAVLREEVYGKFCQPASKDFVELPVRRVARPRFLPPPLKAIRSLALLLRSWPMVVASLNWSV
jgi:hypothetical protein